MSACLGKKGAGSAADLPRIRLLKIEETCRYKEQDEIASGGWRPFSPGSVSKFSAVAYYFARDIHEHAKVPVGVIGSYWDGSPAQAWMSREALAGDPDFAEHVGKLKRDMSKSDDPSGLGKYQRNVPSGLYNGMIRPLAPYGIRGVYGERNLVFSGPIYRSHKAAGKGIEIEFDRVGGGLVGRGGALEGFAIAGGGKKFVWAEAKIVGKDTVLVRADAVPKPRAVRYAWHSNPLWGLKNREGLPASPFRTDDWK